MPNLELYKIFTTIVREKTLTKASEKLNITQPALTKHIKNLENELNITLFIRNKGMKLTEAGEKLYNQISPAVETILQTEKQFITNRNINFGTYATMLSKVLSSCISNYYIKNPNSKIIAVTEPFDSLLSKLENSELDIAVLRKCEDGEYNTKKIKYTKLSEAHYILVANKTSTLVGKTVNIEDLKEELIYIPRGENNSTIEFKNMLKDSGILNEVKRIDTVTMIQILENSNGVGLVNFEYVEDELKEGKIVKLDTNFKVSDNEFGIYVRKDNKFKELDKFISILKEKFV